MFAAHHRIDNLVAMTDWNHQQIDGTVESVIGLGDLEVKITAEGNDMQAVLEAFDRAHSLCGHGKPVMILFKTVMGKGVDFMEGTNKWHGKAPSAEQCEAALAQIKETLGDF